MKRRLSVANALIGSPRAVYLDEPSTGLDLSARRTLWDVITAAKGDGKAIVLTTHSMEEADALCDRIGIMSLGQLVMYWEIGRTKTAVWFWICAFNWDNSRDIVAQTG